MAFNNHAHSKPLALQGNFQGRLPAFAVQAKAAFPQAPQRQRAPHVQAALGQHAPKHYAAQRQAAPQPQTAQPSRIGNAFRVPPTVNLAGTGQGRPLPDAVRQKMESFFNTDFSDVRIHTGAQAQQIGAVAFTLGSDLHFAPGQYNPNTSHGQRLLGHELTHVMQQRAGRVRNPFGSGVAVVQDPGMEAEADRMGIQAAAYRVPVQAKPMVQPRVAPPNARQPWSPAMAKHAPSPSGPQGAAQRSIPVHVSGMLAVGGGSYRIEAGAGGQHIGSVMVHERGKHSVEVTDLSVVPSHRKQGLGGVLMASAMRAGLQLGKSKVTLASQDTGTGRLTAWYKNMGFAQVGSNNLGYPLLEAPISSALSSVAQGRPPKSTVPGSLQAKPAARMQPTGTRFDAVQLASNRQACTAAVVDNKGGVTPGEYKGSGKMHGEMDALEKYFEAGEELDNIVSINISSKPCKYCTVILTELGLIDKVKMTRADERNFGNCAGGTWGNIGGYTWDAICKVHPDYKDFEGKYDDDPYNNFLDWVWKNA